MLPIRRTSRRVGAVLWTAVSMVCIVAGIVVGIARLLMPFASHLEPRVEAWLAEQFGRPVDVAAVGAEWETAGPVIRLAGVQIGEERPGAPPPLTMEQAEVAINPFGWVLPWTRVTDFRIARTSLVLERTAPGRFRLEGLGGAEGGETNGAALDWMLSQGSISLIDCSLTIRDRPRDVTLEFSGLDVTLDNRGLQHVLSGRLQAAQEAGEISFQMEFSTRASGHGISDARLYLEGRGISLHHWLETALPGDQAIASGRVDFRIWGDWGRKGPERVESELDFHDLALGGATMDEAGNVDGFSADRLAATLLWERTEGGWQLFAENIAFAREGGEWPRGGFTLVREGQRLEFGADYVRIEDLAALLSELDLLPGGVRARLAGLNPSGAVHRLTGSWKRGEALGRGLRLSARLEDLAWAGHEGLPALSGVSGRLRMGEGTGELVLRTDRLVFDFPRLFRKPVPLSDLRTRVRWALHDDGWRLELPRMVLATGGAQIRARLALGFSDDGTRPTIDLRGRLDGGDAEHKSLYLPVGVMHPDLVRWLDRSILSGQMVNARFVAYGDLDHWPFDNPHGLFEVRALVRDTVLDYREEWPRLESIRARLLFQGRSMTVTAEQGSVFGVAAERVTARIDNFKQPLLEIGVVAAGPAGGMLRFLRESPLNDEFGPYLAGLRASGRGRVRTQVRLPLKDEMPQERTVEGHVQLEDTSLVNEQWGVSFNQVAGRVNFHQDGFVTDGVNGTFKGEPVTLWLSVGEGKFPDAVGRARLSGALPPEKLLADFPQVAPLGRYLEGTPICDIELNIPRLDEGGRPAAMLTLSSSLEGVAVDLPAPLGKSAQERVPLRLSLPMPYRGEPFSLMYGERLAARLHPEVEGGLRGHLHLGATLPGLPAQPGLVISGRPAHLDLDDWLTLATVLSSDGEGPILRRVSLTAGEMALLGRTFRDLTLEARPADGRWVIGLEGPAMDGSLELPTAAGGGVVADFRHLTWPQAESDSAMPSVDPRGLPPLHMLIEDYTLGDTPLGRTRLEAYPVAEGMRIELFKAESPALVIDSDGRWVVTDEGQRSSFDMTITAENLGGMLSKFGYAGLVEGGQTVAHLDVSWPGAPADFDLSRVRGDLEFSIGEGRMLPVEPGAGRIFGLFSLYALPRRLTLDFSDLFQSGLSFDAIQGSFRFSEGNAFTDDLTLTGPAALIRVSGRVGLAERDYDQEVSVFPSVGNTLPLVGALAGGPTGAAAMFVLQNIFEKQLSDMASYRYAITGSWEDPQVRQISTPDDAEGAGQGVGD